MVNNIKEIRKILDFSEFGTYYFIQIFKRRKDHPDLKYGVIRLECYSIQSIEEFDNIIDEIIDLCNKEGARAYIRLNSQNILQTVYRCSQRMIDNAMRNDIGSNNKNLWNSESGKGGKKDFWVIDIDKEHLDVYDDIVNHVKSIISLHFKDVRKQEVDILTIPTKSGYHIISPPFDVRIIDSGAFIGTKMPTIQIQKDANTLIYSK